MNYKCEVKINLPREAVIALFTNLEHRDEWQPGLIRIERLEGTPFEVNAKHDMYCKMGKKEMIITETILEQHLPDYISEMYVSNGMENISTEEFIANPDHTTTYVSEQEFYSNKLLHRFLLIFAPRMFKKETQKALEAFKAFCEGHDLDEDEV